MNRMLTFTLHGDITNNVLALILLGLHFDSESRGLAREKRDLSEVEEGDSYNFSFMESSIDSCRDSFRESCKGLLNALFILSMSQVNEPFNGLFKLLFN